MRTTVSISDDLLQQAKAASISRNCSLSELVEDSLKIALTSRPKSIPSAFVPLKTFGGTGLLAGVDLTSNASLLDKMEAP